MKFLALTVLASLTFATAQAATIASCSSVEHHGHYVEIKDDNKKITVSITNDSHDGDVFAKILSISKSGRALKDAGASSWAIRQALKGAMDVDMSGVVNIKGTIEKDSFFINFNSYSGQHFLVRGDYVEELKCTNDQLSPATASR